MKIIIRALLISVMSLLTVGCVATKGAGMRASRWWDGHSYRGVYVVQIEQPVRQCAEYDCFNSRYQYDYAYRRDTQPVYYLPYSP